MEDIQQRVAAGLRRMKTKPDALLFFDGNEDWTWDTVLCCDIRVYHSWMIITSDCPFLPIWYGELDDKAVDVKRFREGYADG